MVSPTKQPSGNKEFSVEGVAVVLKLNRRYFRVVFSLCFKTSFSRVKPFRLFSELFFYGVTSFVQAEGSSYQNLAIDQ